METGTSKLRTMLAAGAAIAMNARENMPTVIELDSLTAQVTSPRKQAATISSWYHEMKSKHFTKKGAGRRHFGLNCSGYSQRNDKVGTTKLQRQMKKKAIYPPQKKHPFSSKK